MTESSEIEQTRTPRAVLPQISVLRLTLLRLAYLVMAAGIGMTYWPTVISHSDDFPIGLSLAFSLLAGLGLVAALGLRYPLLMLPILIYEFTWKTVFLVAFAMPLWRSGHIDQASAEYINACLLVVVFIPLMPWRYIIARFVLHPAERWI